MMRAIQVAKMRLAKRGLIVLAEPVYEGKALQGVLPEVRNMAHSVPQRVPRRRALPPTVRRSSGVHTSEKPDAGNG